LNNREKVEDAKPVNGNMNTKNALIEQRRALGLCFKCGDKWALVSKNQGTHVGRQ
jgi:hypothetical protein